MPCICGVASSKPVRIGGYLREMIASEVSSQAVSEVAGLVGDASFAGEHSAVRLPTQRALFGVAMIGRGPMLDSFLMDPSSCRSDLLDVSRGFLLGQLPASPSEAPLFGTAILGWPDRMVVGRDPLGTRPLFVAGKDVVAVCSDPRAIAGLGLGAPSCLAPSGLVDLPSGGQVGLRFRPKAWDGTRGSSTRDLIAALRKAIQPIPSPRAVFFSGGIDSLILAKISEQLGETTCITAGLSGCRDLARAESAASNLSSPLETVLIAPEAIRKDVEFLSEADFAETPMNLAIALPLLHAATKARELGIDTAICGQGADELFGGYRRYLSDPRPQASMLGDLLHLHSRGMDSCTLAVRSRGVEIFLPYLDEDVVGIGLSLPLDMKIRNGRRKVLLRDAGLELGLAERDVSAEKCAIQYGSGVNRHVARVLRVCRRDRSRS